MLYIFTCSSKAILQISSSSVRCNPAGRREKFTVVPAKSKDMWPLTVPRERSPSKAGRAERAAGGPTKESHLLC